jgi:predicted secreted hydrolase
VNPQRRRWLGLLAGGIGLATTASPAAGAEVQRGRRLSFPRDHGAHVGSRTEWWYATGVLQAAGSQAPIGFQVTFFRSRTGLAVDTPGRFAARQLLFAHAAISDIAAKKHHHADRVARWSGDDVAGLRARASSSDTDVALNGLSLRRGHKNPAGGKDGAALDAGTYHTRITAEAFTIELDLAPTQALLLQGDAGYSQKGPQPQQASHYYSQPQLQATGRIGLRGGGGSSSGSAGMSGGTDVRGRAWIDHEWSDEVLPPLAVGWDWIGFNLDDGSALTAFQLRRADGSRLWAGGSFRLAAAAAGAAQAFAADTVRFVPGRVWKSPTSGAVYPVEWLIETPAGRFELRALMDHQELDSRGSTGTVYWEGLSELLDSGGRRIGLGYLEMTGYAGVLKL